MKAKQKSTHSRAAQAMLEFALVGPIFFMCLFAATSAMLYEFERSLVVTGVTTGARTAVSSITPLSLNSNLGTPTTADQAASQAAATMAHSLLGTKVINLNAPGCLFGGLPCTLVVQAQTCLARGAVPKLLPFTQGTVYVYAKAWLPGAPGACSASATSSETQIVASGVPANLVGALTINKWTPFIIPLTIQATVTGVQFQP